MAVSANASTRDWEAPADNTQTLPFECTYPECIKRFATLKDMKQHKLAEPEHNYCKKCDVDCEDWDALTQHKVQEMSPWVDGPMRGNREVLPKHIVCEFCGMDYKTFGARRIHREQCHPAEQHIKCPGKDCYTIFVKAAEFIRHFEDGRCPNISAAEFQEYLEHNHVNKQIMKDTTISERLQENKATADLINGVGADDTDTEYGGVALGGTPSIIDAETDDWRIRQKALEPEYDLISLHEHVSPPASASSSRWPALSSPLEGSFRSMSISSRVPSADGTELTASEYAKRIARARIDSTPSGSGTVYTESYPSLGSPSYAVSMTSQSASDVTASAGGSRAPTAWTTGATSRALFPNAKPTPISEDDEDSLVMPTKDLRSVRWWDPDHEDFEPDFFRNKDLMETNGFGCPFSDCQDTYGYETLDDLKAHIRLAHLTIDHRCPCCSKRFAKASAIMAHAESNGRCKVQASSAFKQLLSDISGGFLKAKKVPVPKIFRPDSAVVLEGGKPINGIMQTEYSARIPGKK